MSARISVFEDSRDIFIKCMIYGYIKPVSGEVLSVCGMSSTNRPYEILPFNTSMSIAVITMKMSFINNSWYFRVVVSMSCL